MLFVLLTLSFTVGSLLASAIAVLVMFKLMTNPKVINWYMKWFMNCMKQFEKIEFDFEEGEAE